MSFPRSLRILVPLAVVALCVAGWSRTQEYEPAKPNAEQQFLAKMEGTWDAKVTMTMGVGGQMVSEGTEVNALVCDGKWLTTDFKSQMMGMPFEGHGLVGWDSHKKKYVGIWVDTFSESLTHMEGEISDGKLTWTYESTMMGMTNKVRDVQTFDGKDKRTFVSSFLLDSGPQEQIRIELTRRSTGQ